MKNIILVIAVCLMTVTAVVNAQVNPQANIQNLSPAGKNAGDAGFTMTINGNDFVSGCAVFLNGEELASVFVSPTVLTVEVPASLLNNAGEFPVQVDNPGPGGDVSEPYYFIVSSLKSMNPTATVLGLSPDSKMAGSDDFTITVKGTDFVNGCVVFFNGEERVTHFVSPTELTVDLLRADVSLVGAYPLQVDNPGPGGDVSEAAYFTVVGGTITGKVFDDRNGNNSNDIGESGLSDRIVSMINGENVMASVKTGVDGMYSFSNLNPGSYTVKVREVSGWRFTSPSLQNGYRNIDPTRDIDPVSKNFGCYKGTKGVVVFGNSRNTLSAKDGEPGDESEPVDMIPSTYSLAQNFPNPFNPMTSIEFTLPQVSTVTLTVYNAIGEEIAVLLSGVRMEGGLKSAEFNAGNLASGTYLYRITATPVSLDGQNAESFVSMKKMVLIK